MPETARVMMDAACSKCGKRFGWQGRVTDMPTCPRCGHRPDDAALKHDQKEMDNFRELLRELRQANPGWDKWQKARVAAGLGLRQAAKLLEVPAQALADIEQGRARPDQTLADRMAKLYGGD